MTLFVTTAISYPNGAPHIGHAYEAVALDAYARSQRQAGEEVRFLTGTDEHGLKIFQKALAENKSPQELVDETTPPFRAMNDALDVDYCRFIRTTDEDHIREAQALWNRLADAGDLYLGKYSGWYSVADEAYVGEDDTIVADGVRLTPEGNQVTWTEEDSWFFRLSKYQQPLLDHLASNPDFIQPATRRNEMLNIIKNGLTDISVSRTNFDWGVPVPGSPGHVMYVWVDALANYLTGAKTDGRDYWPADLHLVGKDILKFHTIYWPAILMSAGLELPKRVFGHGFWLVNGMKMSKTTGNVVDPIAETVRYGSDQLRYFILSETSLDQDGNYAKDAVERRINTELVNNWGNLVQRVCSLLAKNDGTWDTVAYRVSPDIAAAFANLQFAKGIALWNAEVSTLNALVANAAPWKAFKEGREIDAFVVLGVALGGIQALNEAIAPIIPKGAAILRAYLAGPVVPPVVLYPRIP